VPNSLVIAQSIDESDWGQSRFAQDGNNYFGVWCYTPGCGLTPEKKTPGPYYAVKEYSSALNSVEDYMNNLNANNGYQDFRELRARLREEGRPISGLELADTLIYYSQRRDAYVASIQDLIERYNLAHYDDVASEQDKLLSINGYLNSIKKPVAAKTMAAQPGSLLSAHPRRELHPAHNHHQL
jgi:Bax protein